MENNIHNIRVKIDSLSTLILHLAMPSNFKDFYNINGAHTSLLMADEWLKKIIEEIKEPKPEDEIGDYRYMLRIGIYNKMYEKELSQEESISLILKETQEVIPEVAGLVAHIEKGQQFIPIAVQKLTEATFFLKFELERISKVKV